MGKDVSLKKGEVQRGAGIKKGEDIQTKTLALKVMV